VGWLPSVIGYRIAVAFGEVTYRLSAKNRRLVRGNMRRAMGPGASAIQVERATRQAFHNLTAYYYDLVRMPRTKPAKLTHRIAVEGLPYLEQALGKGKGVVLASAHLGVPDLAAQLSLARGVPLTLIVEQLQPPRLHEWFTHKRSIQGLAIETATASGLRAAFRALQKGEAVAVTIDRAIQGNGIVTPFFDEAAILPTGAAELALRTGAALLPAYTLRLGRSRYKIIIEAPIVTVDSGKPRDPEAVTAQLVPSMERHIRAQPGQWMAFHPVWLADMPEKSPPAIPGAGDGKP
jgi:KDO2-lipid IV(A) lauroyltransferase